MVVNAATVGNGTVDDTGEATVAFTLPEKDGKAEMDANVFVDVCDKIRRVVIVEASAPGAAGARGLRSPRDPRAVLGPPRQHHRHRPRRPRIRRCC